MSKQVSPFYKPELDGLRFFAFFFVFIHHHPLLKDVPYLSVIYKTGWIGVDLFFVLSAYLFTKLLILEYNKTQQISYKKFYIRRFFRIWPVYFIFIVFCLVYKYITSGNSVTDQYTLLRTTGLFTFTDNILSTIFGYNNAVPFTAHLWTISFEEQFYLIVPALTFFLVKISTRNRIFILLGSFLFLTILRLIIIQYNTDYLVLWVLPITHFDSILLGIILGFYEKTLPKVRSYVWLISAAVIVIIISKLDVKDVSTKSALLYFLTGLTTVFAVRATLFSDVLKTFLSKTVLVYLGKRSYGLYLYHILGIAVGSLAAQKFFNGSILYSFLISLTATIICAVLSYQIIEKPFLKLKRKFEVVKSRPI